MAIYTNIVADPNAINPSSLVLSLTSKSVILDTAGTNVEGILFNDTTNTLTGNLVSLSAFPGTSFRVDRAYNGVSFAILRFDNSSSTFTCATGTALQTLTDAGFTSTSPEVRRFAGGYAG